MISCTIPNYNHGMYLKKSIEAALDQGDSLDKVYIIDDASTDNSRDILKNYINNPKIEIILNDKNQGALWCVNHALNKIESEYTSFLSADDYILPNFFSNTIETLIKYPQAKICTTKPLFIDGKSNAPIDNSYFMPKIKESCFFSGEEIVKLSHPPSFFWVAGHATIFKTSLIKDIGGFKSDLKWKSDWFLFHILSLKYGVCYLPEELSVLRVLPGSFSSAKENHLQMTSLLIKMCETLIQMNDIPLLENFTNSYLFDHFFPKHSLGMKCLLSKSYLLETLSQVRHDEERLNILERKFDLISKPLKLFKYLLEKKTKDSQK